MSEELVGKETALELFMRLEAPWLFLKVYGCGTVNNVLRGGIAKGEITELVGSVAAGKTQVIFTALK